MMMGLLAIAQTAPPRVAVVNVPMVSDGYVRTGDLEQEFEVLRLKFNEERNRRVEEIRKKREQVAAQFKPGTKDFLKRQEEIMILEARLKFYEQSEGVKLEMAIASSLRTLFEDIKRMVSIVATERGFDVVLAAEQLPAQIPDANALKNQPPETQKAFRQAAQVRGVDLMSRTSGVLSGVHTEADIDQSLAAFDGAIKAMVDEGLVSHG